jgi:hypothetical protein
MTLATLEFTLVKYSKCRKLNITLDLAMVRKKAGNYTNYTYDVLVGN